MSALTVRLQHIATTTADTIQSLHRRSGRKAIVFADLRLGEALHSALHIQAEGDALPDEDFADTMVGSLLLLRERAITSLGKRTLYDDERAAWIEDLDEVSSDAFKMAEAMRAADRAAEAALTEAQKKRAFKDKLRKTAASEGLAGQLELIRKEADGDLGDGTAVPLSEEDKEEIKSKRMEAAQDKWFQKQDETLRGAARFNVSLVNEDDGATVTSYPVILANYRLSKKAQDKLSAAGIRMVKVYGMYQQIHNCRLLAIPRELLPADKTYARRRAQEFLQRMANVERLKDKVRGFYLAHAPSVLKTSHVYFILLPESCRGEIRIESWDVSKPIEGFTKEVSVKDGRVRKTRTSVPIFDADDVEKVREVEVTFKKRQKIKIVNGSYAGLSGKVVGPDGAKAYLVTVNIFGRDTTLSIETSYLSHVEDSE